MAARSRVGRVAAGSRSVAMVQCSLPCFLVAVAPHAAAGSALARTLCAGQRAHAAVPLASNAAVIRRSAGTLRGGMRSVRMATVFDSPVSPIPTIVDLPRPEFKYEPDAFPAAFAGDALVLGFLSDPTESLPVAVEALPDALKDAIRALIKAEKFNAAAGTSASARVLLGDSSPIARIALVGLAPPKKSESENEGVKSGETEESATEKKDESEGWSAAIKHAAGFARESKTCESVGVWLVANSSEDKACGWNKRNVELGVAAALASAYKDERFKGTLFQKDKEKKEKEQPGATASEDRTICITIGGAMDGGEAAFEEATARAMALEAGVTTTKQLVNAPPNVVNPVSLAETARKIAAGSDCLKVWVLEKDECEKRNMGAYLAVARGSEYPPKLIHIVYTPPDATEDVAPARTLAFVGKGLTFDSGGYNIKAGAGSMIELMKFDMGGAAAVLGAAQAIGALKPKGVQVHFVVAACENMVDANAYRPGDVLTASNGITIEIGNTDAEGRLTLADALVFAEEAAEKSAGENGVEFILDVATLTGAIIISLGNDYAGLFPANQAAADKVLAAAKAGGEKMWHMPMPAEYAEQIKSKVADIRNVGGRGGGSITAALFLRNFVKPSTPWAHLDIAGTVWKEGPTGYGVRTLVALAENAS